MMATSRLSRRLQVRRTMFRFADPVVYLAPLYESTQPHSLLGLVFLEFVLSAAHRTPPYSPAYLCFRRATKR